MRKYKLYMTEHEICMAYKYARDKKEQIKILCDLNISCTWAILIVLDYHGYDISKYGSDEDLRMGKGELDKLIIADLEKGLKCRMIAEKLGYSYGYIATRATYLKKHGMVNTTVINDKETDKVNSDQVQCDDSTLENKDDMYTSIDTDTQLLYYTTYQRIENILRLRMESDSDEVKQAFSDLAIKILRSTIDS